MTTAGTTTDDPALAERLAKVELLLVDCDGVLTDGGVRWANDAIEAKTFHIRDGLGLKLWQRAGYRTGIVTGRSSRVVALRA
jgi:3-deoxy-D-manno-octulosonate 8-phosphate phosphatase KdsC-like HAD superfamily phosphatase